MKKLLTLALVGAMLTATGITAFAVDPTTDVTYEVDPIYTVVIPESVTLGDTAVTEQISIYGETADDNVVIGKTQKVNVALTASANGFNVKTADGDTVAYTVNDKNAVADLATVAECTAADGKKDTNITFAKTGTAAYAGTYTDTLTFTVSLEDAVTTPTVGTVFPIGTADLGDYYYWNHEIRADKLRMKFKNFGTATISVGDNYSHPSLGNYRVISINSPTAQAIDWEQTQMDPTGPWAEWSNMPSYNYFKVDNYDTTPTGIRIASGSGTEDDPFSFEIVFD